MSYIYLQEQGEVSSAECFSDIPAYVLSRLNLTAGMSCCNASETESCRGSQYGMTCEPSMEDHGAEKLTLCVEDFHAKISVAPEKVSESTENEAGYGEKWQGSLAKYDPILCSWKTHQCLLTGDLEEFSGTWPRWGMMRDGECLGLTMPEHLIDESEYGFWPTLVKFDAQNCHPFIAEIENEKRLYTISSRGIRATSPLRSWLAAMPDKSAERKTGWANEPDVGRMVYGVANGMDRIAALGNGQVPRVVALAWETLK